VVVDDLVDEALDAEVVDEELDLRDVLLDAFAVVEHGGFASARWVVEPTVVL
jgi:hypothetical protein